ncbi:hypothetical protein V7793_06025 [Streptomyces sp. KLMMK]
MRPAERRDEPAIVGLVTDRINSLDPGPDDRRDLEDHRSRVQDLLVATEEERPLVWVLTEDTHLLGVVLLLPGITACGWSTEQQAEPALAVGAMFTHPATRPERLGRLITWWAADYAARHTSATWLRAQTPSERLMRYARDEVGCEVAGTAQHQGRDVHLLQSRARRINNLHAFIADSGGACEASSPSRPERRDGLSPRTSSW